MDLQQSIILLVLKRAFLPVFVGLLAVSALARLSLLFFDVPSRANGLEQTLVQHQQLAARRLAPIDVLLVGDSSCLMNVAADQLQTHPADLSFLNLGMLSIMPLSSFAQLVADHADVNPGSPKHVILMIHPEMLHQADGATEIAEEAELTSSRGNLHAALLSASGIRPAFDRTVGLFIPQILPARYGAFYGFETTFRRYLQQHSGSAIDPATGRLSKLDTPPFKVSDRFRREALQFRQLIPPNARLFVTLSPIPESAAPRDFPVDRESLLAEMRQVLHPVTTLDLPAILPDIFFATSTHLRLEYRPAYTRFLKDEFLRQKDSPKAK